MSKHGRQGLPESKYIHKVNSFGVCSYAPHERLYHQGGNMLFRILSGVCPLYPTAGHASGLSKKKKIKSAVQNRELFISF